MATGAAGTAASVTNAGTKNAAKFNFVIPQGAKGEKGDAGARGPKGDIGETGPKGDTGPRGPAGADGVSATHSWNGTTLTVTSASGTSSANLKGEKGDTGARGPAGADGHTPVKGTDYFTESDKQEIAVAASELVKDDIVTLQNHVSSKNNPHSVTKSQVGLGNVPNVTTNDQTPTYTAASTLATLVSGEKLSVSMGKIMRAITDLISHIGNKENPHSVTKVQVGLGNVGNFKAVSTVASQGLTNTEKSNARANIGAGTSSLTIGTTASTAAAGNHTHTAANVGAVPTSRTVNGKALSADITLSASDVGARPSSWTPSASDVGALPISGGTLTGNLTGKYITGTWLQVTEDNHLSTASTKIAVLDSSGWVYYRTIAELLADLGIPDATSIRATTSVYGTTKLSTSVTSTSKSMAATPYAVKTALDNAKKYTDSAIGDAIAASY